MKPFTTGLLLITLLFLGTTSRGQFFRDISFLQATQTANLEKGSTQELAEHISTSDNFPTNVQLTAVNDSGTVPSWLTVNGSLMNRMVYPANSDIIFTLNANNLNIGTYSAKVTAAALGYNSGVLTILLTVTDRPPGPLTSIKINFQDSATVPPTGYVKDFGQPFGDRVSPYQGSGNRYGWISRANATPLDLRLNGRRRSSPAGNVLQQTLMHMQGGDAPSPTISPYEGIWQAEVENGNYRVTVSVGDADNTDSKHTINIEGVNALASFRPSAAELFKVMTLTVSVADGYLTVDAIGGSNTKINYIIIQPDKSKRPSVVSVNPPNSSVNVNNLASISTNMLLLPNGGIDNNTITSSTVYLQEEKTGSLVAAGVNGTGGGDGITLVPNAPLKLSTTYRFTVTSGVKDLLDSSFIPYSSVFTTSASTNNDTINAKFTKIALPNTIGQHSSLAFGPDGKLYALTIDGIIERFAVNSDGTLADPQKIYTLQDENGVREQRIAIGFAFDPSSTKDNPIIWITHSTFKFLDGPEWDGKLSKLWGANLENIQDVLINLPRSTKDHLTNSIAFGPDGALYFNQGANSAMGKADKTWNYRDEHLLSASCLRLDLSRIKSFPLDVKTPEGGGSYNPYASGAPLTLYATGVRNAYDLLWHSNGQLYLPTNGSAAGGNTPASVQGTTRPDGSTYSGPDVPAINSVPQTQNDYLFRIQKGGYYGHPNPLRGEYVLNGGNPTSAIDPAEVLNYPVGTMPDKNYRGFAYNFQNDKSPNGVIEYKSNTFNGALKGKILVVRYSQNDDIIVLTPGGTDKDIVSATEGSAIMGFSGFQDPLDLTEDLTNGNIYVSEYGGEGRITLLKAESKISAEDPEKLVLYPNPTTNYFHIRFPASYEGFYMVQIVDVSGRSYGLENINIPTGGMLYTSDLSNRVLPPGVYYIRLLAQNKPTAVFKLVINR